MSDVTLEALARRVEALEKKVAELSRPKKDLAPAVAAEAADRWRAASEAAKALTDYDFSAWQKQRPLDQQHARDHLP